jgi:hypothetical protein
MPEKHSYSTEHQAYVAARKSGFTGVVAYEQAGRWFITRSKPYPHKRDTLPKANGPKPYVQSAAKLRRKLENAGREIRACENRIRKSEELRILAERSQAVYQEELRTIEIMVGRITWK